MDADDLPTVKAIAGDRAALVLSNSMFTALLFAPLQAAAAALRDGVVRLAGNPGIDVEVGQLSIDLDKLAMTTSQDGDAVLVRVKAGFSLELRVRCHLATPSVAISAIQMHVAEFAVRVDAAPPFLKLGSPSLSLTAIVEQAPTRAVAVALLGDDEKKVAEVESMLASESTLASFIFKTRSIEVAKECLNKSTDHALTR